MKFRTKQTDWREAKSIDELATSLAALGWRKRDDDFLILEDESRGFAQVAHYRSGKYIAEWRTSHSGKLLRAQTRKSLGRILDRPPRNSSKFAIYQCDILKLQDGLDILNEFWLGKKKPRSFFWRDLTPCLLRYRKSKEATEKVLVEKARKKALKLQIAIEARIKKEALKKIHDLRPGDVIVDVDWCSTGIWVCNANGKVCNGNYMDFDLPKPLLERFGFWTTWYNSHEPWNGETINYDLFRAYGRGLAVDLKRIVGNKSRVFYGFYFDQKRKYPVSEEEIVLPNEDGLQEYGLTEAEMAAAEKRIERELKSARTRREVTSFTGGKNDFD